MGGISHPAAIGRELPIKGVMDKEAGFTVAERQNPDLLIRVGGISDHVEDEPAIWRPARGPNSLARSLRRQQQLLATSPVGIHLINARPSLAGGQTEQDPASIGR